MIIFLPNFIYNEKIKLLKIRHETNKPHIIRHNFICFCAFSTGRNKKYKEYPSRTMHRRGQSWKIEIELDQLLFAPHYQTGIDQL